MNTAVSALALLCLYGAAAEACTDLQIKVGGKMVDWYDKGGPEWNCKRFEEHNLCAKDGAGWRNVYVANEACCCCGGGDRGPTPKPAPATPAPPAPEAEHMSFLAIGDWGGGSDDEPTTRGENENNLGMGAVAERLGNMKFVMALGDNFYHEGVDTCHSPRFEETFEAVFTHPKLQVPWHVVAGNHDHYGNVQAQIDYSSMGSGRWHFPSLYYKFSDSFMPKGASKAVTTEVIYIDTVTFSGQSYHDELTGEFVKGSGPVDVEAYTSQMSWLETQLKESTADYLWVSGHYPVYSHCDHGPTSELVRDVLPLLKRYNANGFIAGHDHCLGHYADSSMAFVLSGAGQECCYDPKNERHVPSGYKKFGLDSSTKSRYGSPSGGFVSFNVTADHTTIAYHAGKDGDVLFTGEPVRPRGNY